MHDSRGIRSIDPGKKEWKEGTHRTVEPETTLARMRRFMPLMGITRVANVTGLDRIGIPVAIVCRPNSRSVAVSQGKGITYAAAEASGLMEAIENYHAEHITLPLKYASYEDLRYTHNVTSPETLAIAKTSRFHPCLPILWIEGYDLLNNQTQWLPFELVHTNYTKPLPSGSGCFLASSNGLASGNHPLEAISHGICEVIERDSTALWYRRQDYKCVDRRLCLETITDSLCQDLLYKFKVAGIDVAVWNTTTDIGVPSFYCWIMERDHQSRLLDRPTVGAGCHLSPQIALSRALTEAAQDRLTLITGSRDDLHRARYQEIREAGVFRQDTRVDYATIAERDTDTLQDDLKQLLNLLRDAGIEQVVVVELMKPEFENIPVVRIVIPCLEGPADAPSYVCGRRALSLNERTL